MKDEKNFLNDGITAENNSNIKINSEFPSKI